VNRRSPWFELVFCPANTLNPPASTFVVVSRLVQPEWLIEIEAVAVIGR
jgi:enamine deaminase RidA (YjgF/YER057c/UK114 family)